MFSIEALLSVLGGVTDSATVIQSVRRRLRNLSANKTYIDMLDEQFRNERTHAHLDVHLDKNKMKQAMRQAAVDLKRAPLLADELDNTIGDSIVAILMSGVVVSGSSTLDEHRARTLVKRVHEQYFEKVKAEIPELVDVLQHQEVIYRLNALNISLSDLRLEQVQQSRTLDQIVQNTDKISDSIQRTSLQIEHSQLSSEANQQEILGILNQLSTLIAPSNSRISFEAFASADAPPQFGTLYTSRTEPVQSILELLNKHDWVSVMGQTGSGKTSLAAIVHASGQYQSRWISFLGYDGNEARDHLYKQLFLWSTDVSREAQAAIPDDRLNLDQLTDTIASSTQNGLVILDNLPDPANPSNDLLYHDLRQIGRSFSARNILILSTGQRGLPAAITSALSTVSLDAPPLSKFEIAEMCHSAKATEYYLRESTVTYIRTVTKGLVTLVAAYIVWYKRHNWPQNAEFIESILTDKPGIELREENQRKLYRLLEDNAIELLSRLSLLVSDFDPALVTLVAQLPDEILQPHFVFSELKNVWVAQLETDRYQVSPLLKDIGRKNLSVEKQRLVASSVADFYMKERQPISLDDVLDISLYLWSASRQTDYAMFLAQALIQVTNVSQAEYLRWAVSVPSPEIGFPDDVPLSLQIILRTQQFRVALLAQASVQELDIELDRLISIATDKDVGAVIYAYIMTGTILSTHPFNSVNRLLDKSIRQTFKALHLLLENPNAFEDIRHELGDDTSAIADIATLTDKPNVGSIVWFWVDKINTQERALLFLEEIYNASKEVREAIFSSPLVEGLPFILDQLWLLEGRKPEEVRDKAALVPVYDRALEFAKEHDIAALQVAAARAKSITLSEMDKGLARAVTIMKSLPQPDDNDLVAWINITLALLYNDFGIPENARIHLEKVIELPGSIAEQWRTTMRKHLLVTYSKLGLWEEARRQAIIALKETKDGTHPQYSCLEILGELAFVHWNLGDKKRSCGTLYAIYKSLQDGDQFTTEEFNEIYNKFSHAMGWYSNPQRSTSLGLDGEAYRPVEAGFFTRSFPNLRGYEREQGNTLLGPAVLLNLMAVDSDAHRIAWQLWLQIKDSKELEGTFFKFFAYNNGAPLEARFGSPTQAVDYGVSSFKLKSLSQNPSYLKEPQNVFREINIEAAWNSLSESQQASYESLLLYEVLVPLFIELLARNVSKKQIIETFQEYRVSIEQYADLHSYQSFRQTIDHFEQLLLARANRISVAMVKTDVEAIDLLGILSTYDLKNNLGIRDKLQVQATIAVHIWENRRYIPIKHTMYGLGRMLHSFWTNVVENQRFSLSQPNIMQTRLKKTSHCRSEKTVAEVLRIAADGVNLSLEDSVKNFVEQALDSGSSRRLI